MGHRDDFYSVDNIAGYTGKVNKNPTVYFVRNTDEGVEFGRITQAHKIANNVGRGKVRIKDDYQVGNIKTEKTFFFGWFTKTVTQGVEYYDGAIQHASRNEFIPRGDFKKNELELLAQSIIKHQNLKPKY